MITRHEFVILFGGAAVACPLEARAQQSAPRVIGFLDSSSSIPNTDYLAAFRQGLAEAGFVEGQNVAIDYRQASTRIARLTALAELEHTAQLATLFALNMIVLTNSSSRRAERVRHQHRLQSAMLVGGLTVVDETPHHAG